MDYSLKSLALLASLPIAFHVTHAQSPGGVSGQGYWYLVTSQDSATQINGHPLLDTSQGGLTGHVNIDGLRQGTVIGLFGQKADAGQHPESIYSVSRNGAESYGLPHDNVFAYADTLVRVTTQYRADKPDHSVWGYDHSSSITVGTGVYVGELIAYPRVLNPMERRQVESNLAIKYGVTLTGSYLGSDGSVLWDRWANADYHHRVFGIARDSLNGFEQYRSSSSYETGVNAYSTDRTFTMYKQNIAPMKDGAYIICGDDGGSMDLTQLSNGSPWRVCGRTWKYYADNVDDLQTQIEWNYYRGWAYGLSGNKLKASFLIFHDGDLDSRMQDGVSFHQCNTVNSMSHRLLFPDVTWDGNDSGFFTFAVYDGFLLHITPEDCSCYGSNGTLYVETLNDTCQYEFALLNETLQYVTEGICNDTLMEIDGLEAGRYLLMVHTLYHDIPIQYYDIYIAYQCENDISYASFHNGCPFILPNDGMGRGFSAQMSYNSQGRGNARAKRNETTGILSATLEGDGELSVQLIDATTRLHEAVLKVGTPTQVSFAVYDAAGQLLHSYHCTSDGLCSYRFTLPLSGAYIVKAYTDTNEFTRKIYSR